MVAVRIPTIGQILLSITTLMWADGAFSIKGHDEANNNYVIKCAKISWQDDYSSEYGWAHIIGYTTNGITTSCSILTSIG